MNPVRLLKLYRLVKQAEKELKEMKFTLTKNMVIQAVAIAAELGGRALEIIPKDSAPLVALSVNILQLVAGYLAHTSNPDGSPIKKK